MSSADAAAFVDAEVAEVQRIRVDSRGEPSDAFPVLTLGVQTWGTEVAALQRYWAAAEALGYDRVVYGDGLWPWTYDGWTMLGALAAQTHTWKTSWYENTRGQSCGRRVTKRIMPIV